VRPAQSALLKRPKAKIAWGQSDPQLRASALPAGERSPFRARKARTFKACWTATWMAFIEGLSCSRTPTAQAGSGHASSGVVLSANRTGPALDAYHQPRYNPPR